MRILHTSDWHLGRSFHREPLLEAQRAFLEYLIDVAQRENVDVVTVAGDVYDRAIPPLEAIDLFQRTLAQLAGLKVPLVMISGNHDSPRRLGVNSRLIEHAGIHLRTDPHDSARPAVLHDTHGDVAFYGLPYLEPALVRESLGAPATSHQAVLGTAMDRIREDLATRPGTRAVVLAHAFVTGAEPTPNSERDITVGGVANVPAALFHGMDYVALGHLHRSQSINDRIRYSGSPLPYSFSEAGHPKSMWLVDLDGDGSVTARTVACPEPYRLDRLEGELDELLTQDQYADLEQAWLHVTLTDTSRPHMAMERLRQRFPHVLKLTHATTGASADDLPSRERMESLTDHEIALEFLRHVTHAEATEPERDLLHRGIEHVRVTARGEAL
ncbi:exonuclease SbcCD subunit D [Kitasatospora sp. NPDC051170]|uniref:exonuclease SbcCD subunit D n=1 Tax=Kitasatospora sp. NPDC051170 TaxID=3364056 RepID=UPI0037BA97F0